MRLNSKSRSIWCRILLFANENLMTMTCTAIAAFVDVYANAEDAGDDDRVVVDVLRPAVARRHVGGH